MFEFFLGKTINEKFKFLFGRDLSDFSPDEIMHYVLTNPDIFETEELYKRYIVGHIKDDFIK